MTLPVVGSECNLGINAHKEDGPIFSHGGSNNEPGQIKKQTLYIYFCERTVYFSKRTAYFSERIFKKRVFEIMSRIPAKSTKLGILDFGMTGPYHKIGNFLFSMSTPTPKFMFDRV